MSALRYSLAALIGAVITLLVISQRPELIGKINDWVAAWTERVPDASQRARNEEPVVPVESWHDDGGFDHFLGPRVSIRVENDDRLEFGSGEIVKLRVGRDGSVISARCLDCRKEFASRAEQLARSVRFVPFQREGKPVIAEFEFQVPILPKEVRPQYKVEFPQIKDWSSIRIEMSRSGCFGTCPSYSVQIAGDGSVRYVGDSFVALMGAHRAQLPAQTVQALVKQFQRAEFFWLNSSYVADITDSASTEVSISFDGRTHRVHDYVGLQVGMPDSVRDVQDAIDRLANTDRWLKGNAETAASLVAEGWDFKSASRENKEMLIGLARYGSVVAVREVMALGAPVTTQLANPGPWGVAAAQTALEAAIMRGSSEIAMLLLAHDLKWDRAVLQRALFHAASRGWVRIMYFLDSAGNIDQSFTDRSGTTVLMAAAESAVPEAVSLLLTDFGRGRKATGINARDWAGTSALFFVGDADGSNAIEGAVVNRAKVIELLVAAGADVDLRDKDGNTALIDNFYADSAQALINAGANVNAQNEAGETALMQAYIETALVLLKAGADPSLKNAKGETAVDVAKREGRKDVAALVEGWMKKRSPEPRK
jgi:hypothetical protein